MCGLHGGKLCGLQLFAEFCTFCKKQMSFRAVQEDLKRNNNGGVECGFPAVSLFFPAYPYLFGNRNTLLTFASEINNYANKTTTKKMKFTAIDTSAWEELKESIVELTDCFNEHFAPPAELPDLLHNGDVYRILNISKRTLQHYRDTSVLPFIQIGHKCYYKREDVEKLLAKSDLHK